MTHYLIVDPVTDIKFQILLQLNNIINPSKRPLDIGGSVTIVAHAFFAFICAVIIIQANFDRISPQSPNNHVSISDSI
jgi:hypothetical protein